MNQDIMSEIIRVYGEEKGIVKKKGFYFNVPSSFAKDHLIYVLWSNEEYTCIPPYKFDREGLDSLLLFRITHGELCFIYRGIKFSAKEGDVVLLDCNTPQSYWAEKKVSFQFVHFKGSVAGDYCEQLYQMHGPLFQDISEMHIYIRELFDELKKEPPSEYLISKQIYDLFCCLASEVQIEISPLIQSAQQYMEENLGQPLTVDEIAEEFSFSRGYFTRKFKCEVGVSPYEYLNRLRLRQACNLLARTDKTIETIAYECGFSSASNFIRAFKKGLDSTPAKFRKQYH